MTEQTANLSLTDEQAVALNSLEAFLLSSLQPNSTAKTFVLSGFAGTGKSYCIRQALSFPFFEGKPSSIAFTAPTNKAVRVLREYLREANISSPTSTIYSLLGLKLMPNGEVKELTLPEDGVPSLKSLKAIVVDEASMLSKLVLDLVLSETGKIPIIFLGDPAQLPPVGEVTSPVWDLPNRVELTKVMRYSNSILDFATHLREKVFQPFGVIQKQWPAPVFTLSEPAFLDRIQSPETLAGLVAGTEKVITWRNVKVDTYNSLIRRKLYSQALGTNLPDYLSEDRIVMTAPFSDLDGKPLLTTDDELSVISAVEAPHPLEREIACWHLRCHLPTLTGKRREVILYIPTRSGQVVLTKTLNDLSAAAKKGEKHLWKKFWVLKDRFAQCRHAYAITAHRSQGSSYTRTYVDSIDLLLNRERGEALRALYVACTRAREELFLL